jgi:hypothetical protein
LNKGNKTTKEIEILLNNFEERFNGEIENNSINYLNKLKLLDTSFYENEKMRFEFNFFISAQQFRTKKFKEAYTTLFNHPIHGNSKNLVNIIRQIFTVNFAYFLTQKEHKIQLLINESDFPFITGDQPVINLNSINNPKERVLYYPITPKIAIKLIYSDKNNKDKVLLNNNDVKYLNNEIAENSYFQIYSNSENLLKNLNFQRVSDTILKGKSSLAPFTH